MLNEIKLSPQYIEKVKQTVTPHWGELGWVTYKRTYARWLEDQQRTENWDETVKRVIEGNINLDPRLHQEEVAPAVIKELTAEAEALFKMVYGLAIVPSGRNLWISGTNYQKRTGDSLNNCWFIAIRPQAYGNSHIIPSYLKPDEKAVSMPYSFMFDESMKGGGVGFSVVKENIAQIPAVDQKIKLEVVIDRQSQSYEDALMVGAFDFDEWKAKNNLEDVVYYEIPDTREGWVLANAMMIDMHFNSTNKFMKQHLVLDISKIRTKGTKIHGFGGTSSGPMPLVELLNDVNNLLNNRVGAHLSSVDCTDIGNLIGKTVVAGNVRRSAELALGSNDDQAFITMKQDQEKLNHHRWASNNSVAVDSQFTNYQPIADSIQHNGEPGILNLELSQNYGRIIDGRQPGIDAAIEGTNPCGEISLANGEPCNLFDVFPYIVEQQGWDLKQAFKLAARYTKRVTFSKYDWEISREIIHKNRRIGVSMSGIQDWLLNSFHRRAVKGFEEVYDEQLQQTIKKPIYDEEICQKFDELYQTVVAADLEYSAELGCAMSIKHTTVKPSGTVAKLAGVSEGMHFHYAGYLIQRIRFQDTDPLLPALKKCGYHMEPDIYTPHTMCVEFPLRAAYADNDQFVSAGDVSIEEQFATQAFLQTYWSDNAVSCTITFKDDEADKIASLFQQYRFITKSTSLLPYFGGELQQAPKQPISKTEFKERKAEIAGNPEQVFAQLNQTDVKGLELIGQSDCEGGACPIK